MSELVIDSNLFRFVSVRPVQHVAEDERRILFIEPNAFASEFVNALDDATSFSARQEVAADFIRTVSYVAGFVTRDPWVGALRRVLDVLGAVTPNADLGAAKQRVQEIVAAQPPLADAEMRSTVRRRLWSSLYATFLSPRSDPRDRAELIALVRALHAIDHLDALGAARDVARTLKAEPLVPVRWFGTRTAEPTLASESGQTPGNVPGLTPAAIKRLQEANSMRQRYFNLDVAIADLRLTERRARASVRTTAAPPASVAPGSAVPGKQIDTGSGNWRLPADAIRKLQPKTLGFISEVARDLTVDSTTDVLQKLESVQQLAANRLSRVGGARALVNLDPVLKPTLGAGDILLSPTDHTNAKLTFDEPYEGSVGSVKPLGIGDLLVVKETLLRYELGQVAHIENVMQTESRERVHRQLDRVQTTFTTATQTTETNERDLESTERYEMQNEVATTLETDMSLSTGISTSASYGPVKVNANADFATSSSTSDSQTSSTTYARDVTDRSLSSLTRRIQEKTVTQTLTETEETNTHGFDNSTGTEHVVGIYRWVDKRYQAQVMNYGKRLMLEFIVPEPASFYNLASMEKAAGGVLLPEPEPLPEGFSFHDITESTYQTWIGLYQVSNVDPPPPMYKTVGKAIEVPEVTHGLDLSKDVKGGSVTEYILTTKTETLEVPAGYQAIEAWVSNHSSISGTASSYTHRAAVGRSNFEIESGDNYEVMENEDGIIPIAVKAFNVLAYALTIEVRCERTDTTLEAWQLATYQAVVTAYNNLKVAYDAQVAAASVQNISTIAVRSPDANRLVEQDELKKGCIVLLTDQHFEDAGAVTFEGTPFGYPEIRVRQAMDEGGYVQFIEQLLEWDQMTYTFYPYFWGRKEDWVGRSMADDPDPMFAAFLKAGAARVLVPVRRGYEKALIYFLETAQIWNGGGSPTINSPLYVSIVEEMQEATDVAMEDAAPDGEPWEYTLPTTLVMLQEDATLPVFVEPVS